MLQTDDLELKKLVYLYLINYAKTQPDLAIMGVNTFVKVICLTSCLPGAEIPDDMLVAPGDLGLTPACPGTWLIFELDLSATC